MSTSVFIALIGLLVSVLSFVVGQRQGIETESREKATLLADLEHIKRGLEELKDDVKEINIGQINVEICEIKRRINNLEMNR